MLRNKLEEIEIPEDNPFLNDAFKRKSSAEILMAMTRAYAHSGGVIALNGDWGTGKTTFVKMTIQKMKNDGFHPLYFNAWENDYVSDPMVALLSELKEVEPDSDKLDDVITKGCRVMYNILGSIVKGYLKSKFSFDTEAISAGVDETVSILKENVSVYKEQKKELSDFIESLAKYIAESTIDDCPVVFFVDELDRCNPHFAVKVLERIKHLFEIPNIVFVLSINKSQLEYAIQGYYGNSNIDATKYLRRFVDIEFSLPTPDAESICEYLYQYYDFDKVFKNDKRSNNRDFEYDEDSFNKMAVTLIGGLDLDIRTIDKIYAHTRLALIAFSSNSYIIPDVFFLMCYLKIVDSKFYSEIENHTYKAQDLLSKFEKYFPVTLLTKTNNNDIHVIHIIDSIVSLIHMYDRNSNGIDLEDVFHINDGDQPKLTREIMDKEIFEKAYKWECQKGVLRDVPLDLLISKINLQYALINKENL